MTREQGLALLHNLPVIRHWSKGGEIEFCFHDYTGKFLGWRKTDSIILSCLGRYRIKKPHYTVKNGKLVPKQFCDCIEAQEHNRSSK